MRAVVDTNILVRALIKPQGTVAPVLHRLRDGLYTLIYSDGLIEELVDVLSRPRIRDKYSVDQEVVEALLQLILAQGESAAAVRTITVCRDPKDNKVLEAGLSGRADVIVSGDEDLLVLNPFEGIPILGPKEFLERLEEGGSE